MGDDDDQRALHEHTVRYNNTAIARATFSLCPSGAGPNSTRPWESLAVAAYSPIRFNKRTLLNQYIAQCGTMMDLSIIKQGIKEYHHNIVHSTEPENIAYQALDVILCGALSLPGIAYFALHSNWCVLIHGIAIGTLSVLADGLQMSRLLFWDRIGALSTFVVWFAYGIYLTRDMSALFAMYEISMVLCSLVWQQLASMYFYHAKYEKSRRNGIFYQRLWHIGASWSMLSLVLYGAPHTCRRLPWGGSIE